MKIAPRPNFVRNSSQVIVPELKRALFFSDGRREDGVPFVVSSLACQFAIEISALLLCKDGVFPCCGRVGAKPDSLLTFTSED